MHDSTNGDDDLEYLSVYKTLISSASLQSKTWIIEITRKYLMLEQGQ